MTNATGLTKPPQAPLPTTRPTTSLATEPHAQDHTQRSANLDAIRGFALLGIFFMNIYFMGNNFYGYAPHQPQIASDVIVEVLSNFLVEGRFISLFSLLFGVGLYIQCQRIELDERRSIAQVKSRLRWLIVFGLAHGLLIFSGDILLTYGLCGLLALCYIDYQPEQLFRKATQFIVIAFAVIALVSITIESDGYYRGSELFLEQLTIWTGSYSDQLQAQAIMMAYMALVIPLTLLWYNGALMLIGIALYKRGHFVNGFSTSQLLLILILSCLLALIDTLLGFSSSAVLQELANLFMMLGAIPMALIYIHVLIKLCQNRHHYLTWLQQVGKLSLSLYILQSIVGIMLFRHWMPDWQLSFDRWHYMLVAVIYTLVQIGFACVYFNYFKQGPLEYLLRRLSQKTKLQGKSTT
ncbi:DUF418 domain-containing protein [Shewanella waksmanii]|uniref:DUF418 domain-containing protein n=1 Tax=Shewanella waksmanii TaxID=213783 RepID=UPI00048E693E|nr:DUF418 domain-containing protein [Shewanella waksmanii]